jgi:hypothetical protein
MATASTGRRVTVPTPTSPSTRQSLSAFRKGGSGLPPRVVLHGQSGIGKSSTAAASENNIFLMSPGETGLVTLIDAGIVSSEIPYLEVTDWESLLSIIGELTTTSHQRKTLVLDTIDGFEKLALAHTCRVDYGNDWSEKGFEGFQRGYKTCANGAWRTFLAALDKLRTEKAMWIVALAHTGVGNFRNPTGNDFSRYTPSMHKSTWELTMGWADIVLFADRPVFTDKQRGEAKAKAKGIGDRVMVTEWDAVADAKNRHGLPPEIDMGKDGNEAWANFTKALNEAKSKGEVK